MSDRRIEIVSFTVSTSFETHRGGEKSSHFVSMGVNVQGATMDEFSLIQLQSAYKVSVAAIQDALMRGAITLETANDRISEMQNNYEAIRAKLQKNV